MTFPMQRYRDESVSGAENFRRNQICKQRSEIKRKAPLAFVLYLMHDRLDRSIEIQNRIHALERLFPSAGTGAVTESAVHAAAGTGLTAVVIFTNGFFAVLAQPPVVRDTRFVADDAQRREEVIDTSP